MDCHTASCAGSLRVVWRQKGGERGKLRLEPLLKFPQDYSAIKRNGIGSFVETWMDLDTVIQSEVIQKEKNKYRMLTHIYGI